MIIGKYHLRLLKKCFLTNQLPGITTNHCLKPRFLKIFTLRQPRSHDAIKITHFFMQMLKVDQVSLKLLTKCLSDVDAISRNQVLFSEKTEQLCNFWNP